MTRAVRDLSLTTNTPQGFKNVTQYGGGSDNFDSASPSRLSFYVDDEAVILGAELRVEISAYRTWETDTASGGSSTPTSGASSAGTTANGGGSTPTTSAGPHVHAWGIHESDTPGAFTDRRWSEGYASGTKDFNLETNGTGELWTSSDKPADHDHDVTIAAHSHSMPHTHQVTIAAHSHSQTYEVVEVAGLPGPISISLDSTLINSLIAGPFTFTSLPDTINASLEGLTTPGWHQIEVSTSSGLARASIYVVVKSLQL